MSDQRRSLSQLQQWMQKVITHPFGVESGIESPDAQRSIDTDAGMLESVICRSKALSSIQRLEVYGNAYFARLLECMRELFPATAYALTQEGFDAFAFDYLQHYPSQSYTLTRLADCFVGYLEETRPTAEVDSDQAPDSKVLDASWPDFLIDLARLEWTIDRVFDGPGVEGQQLLTTQLLLAVPPESWPHAALVPVPCLKLLAFQYPVNHFYTQFRQGDQPTLPAPEPSYAAVTRRDYIVRRYDLSRIQFDLLSVLMQGQSVGDAIAAAAESCDDLNTLAGDLRRWFSFWAAEDFFQRIELPPT